MRILRPFTAVTGVRIPLGTPLHGFSREQFLEASRHGSGRSPRAPCDRAAGTSLARPEVRLTRLLLFAGVDLTKLLYLKILVLPGLHYTAVTPTTGETRGAVILGGGGEAGATVTHKAVGDARV